MATDESAARVRTLSLLLKLGHNLFEAADFDDAAARAVNDSKMLLNFRSAALFEKSGNEFILLAQSGIPEKNPRSKLILEQIKLLKKVDLSAPSVIRAAEYLSEPSAADDGVYLIMQLTNPAGIAATAPEFVWILEYACQVPSFVEKVAVLLGSSVAEALSFHRAVQRKSLLPRKNRGKALFWLIILLLTVLAMFIRVPESVTAEFTLQPSEITAAYANFDGTIAECLRQDGESVSAGDVIARYDTALLQYRLEQAQSQLDELSAEIALEERNAFTESEKLGKVRLLNARKEILLVSVKEAQWYLKNSEIKAPADGILVLGDSRAEKLAGKSVRTGDKIFEIYGGEHLVAEIPVDEKDSSILQDEFSGKLFLHTAPDREIPVAITDVAAYPELTEQKSFCYNVRGKVAANIGELRCGMRGIARLSGRKVTLGYRLFKSVLLYFRGL